MKKRVFSGIQPQVASILETTWVRFDSGSQPKQNLKQSFALLICMLYLTVPQRPEVLASKIREIGALMLASGVDPKGPVLVQSDISAHAELAWILNCFIPMGWMQRMTQFKEKSKNRMSIPGSGAEVHRGFVLCRSCGIRMLDCFYLRWSAGFVLCEPGYLPGTQIAPSRVRTRK